ncbi:hypothetical protein JNUCC83_12445 (plasmid) [Vagococcus sp. JNUCC 83]
MTNKEERLLKNYQQKVRELEEQEDEIKHFQRKGQQIADDAYAEIRHLLNNSEDSNEILNESRKELSMLEEEYTLTLSHERRKLLVKKDELEQTYRNDLKKTREGD